MIKRFFAGLLVILLSAVQAIPCSTVVVGKKATADGSVLFAHNEDDSGRRIVNVWRVGRHTWQPGDSLTLIRGGRVAQVPETWSYLWFQISGLEFSDYYVNEWGVHVGSDACASREDDPELTDGGIGYMLRRLVAERARSAREGVRIAGDLLDRFGYASSGRTLVICDAGEAWLLAMAAGKHWVAQRVPDHEAVVLPNVYVIRDVDFNDPDRFITSAQNVRDYAVRRGWYDPDSGRPFDFARAYMDSSRQGRKFMERGYDTRQWRGQQLLTGNAAAAEDARLNGLPFSVRPDRKITVSDLTAILRDHYEGSAYGPAADVRMEPVISPDQPGEALPRTIFVNPNFTTERTICTPTTQIATVARIRGNEAGPLQSLLWFCMGRPDAGVFVPWYTWNLQPPPAFHRVPGISDPESALENHFQPVFGQFDYNADAAFWICNDLENLTDAFYENAIDPVRRTWRRFEASSMQEAGRIEAWAASLSPDEASRLLTDFSLWKTAAALDSTRQLTQMLKTRFYH